MKKEKELLTVPMTRAERAEIIRAAKRVDLSQSEFTRRALKLAIHGMAVLGERPPNDRSRFNPARGRPKKNRD